MFTVIFLSFKNINGIMCGLAVYLIVIAAAFLLYILPKENRMKKNLIRYYSITAAVMIVSDILLYLYFVDNGSYVNQGMQGIWLSALPLVFLIVNLFVQTIYNYAKKPKQLNI